ncbi:Os03g0802400 [Oryza sativa Japonica Group]|uniref:Os03g0802400 protein n=2 Tax=Oryza sativa subsp. japonica TaxID=39947 RepID=Q0DMM4_ORYSJ|nr:hypothetical protein EE612_021082 [Oryza sativa]BAF13514.1 Os03g0802400 [Oryza sativa Japonica Group]BAS86904.1 Os03g0802400 [Oryza sativa Japonica Group]|eukprot:NP_001051600.1 Os03g0802400 [Oryza sativa Japonica Group]
MVTDRYGSTSAASRRACRFMCRPTSVCSCSRCRFCHTTVHSTAIRLSTTPEFSPFNNDDDDDVASICLKTKLISQFTNTQKD